MPGRRTYLSVSDPRGVASTRRPTMNAANLPEMMVLLALLVSVACWNAIKLILTMMAVGFVLLVLTGMAGYGVIEMLAR
jgi:hypothetical protein